jgi:hypothetical protein
MKPNNDNYEIAHLYDSNLVPLYLKHDWVLLEVKDRPWTKGEDDYSCPVIFVMGKVKKDRPK